MKKAILALLMVAALAAIGVSVYKIITINETYEEAERVYDALDIYRPVSPAEETETIESNKERPDIEKPGKQPRSVPEEWVDLYADSEETDERLIQIRALQAEYPDVVGWLTIPGTDIDYPIVQTNNNTYYLRRDINKNYLYAGTPFLDFQCSPDFTDKNSIIYGHHMNNGIMFYDLGKFKNKSYFEDHKELVLVLPDRIIEGEIFAAVVIDANTQTLPYELDPGDKHYNALRNISRQFDSSVKLEESDTFLTLSTCDYETENGRMVIVARLPAAPCEEEAEQP